MKLLQNKQLLTIDSRVPSPTMKESERSSPFTFFSLCLKAGMTVEASIVLPLCLLFLFHLSYAVEMIRLHNNLQIALLETGNQVALYGCDKNGSNLAAIASGLYIRGGVIDYVGEDYLDNSPLTFGSRGLQMWESKILQDDMLNVTITYSVSPLTTLVGFRSFRMANHYYAHLWNGYDIEDRAEIREMVYIAENGEVWHESRNCTYLKLSVRMVEAALIGAERNQWGHRYSACEKCAKGHMPEILYITSEGTRYHFDSLCSGLKRTVYSVDKEKAESRYRPCSRCTGK